MNLLFFLKPGLYVSKRTVIHGNITSDDNGYIEGVINGDITIKATLIIEKKGVINGDVHAKDVFVKGKVKGNVYCNGKVSVLKKGEVDGNVYANEAIIDKESLLKGGMAQLANTANTNFTADQEEGLANTAASVLSDKPVADDAPQNWF